MVQRWFFLQKINMRGHGLWHGLSQNCEPYWESYSLLKIMLWVIIWVILWNLTKSSGFENPGFPIERPLAMGWCNDAPLDGGDVG